jgi:hypothetical protein
LANDAKCQGLTFPVVTPLPNEVRAVRDAATEQVPSRFLAIMHLSGAEHPAFEPLRARRGTLSAEPFIAGSFPVLDADQ